MKYFISKINLTRLVLISLFIMVIFFISPLSSRAQHRGPDRIQRAMMHHEVPDNLYQPESNINAKTSKAYRRESSVFFTTQVNINASGENIVGDAANEPSIAVDPTNPNRMVIGWRQFDNVNNNFRQAGYGYSTDAGETWTFPGVIDPGVFRSDPVLDVDANGNFYYNSLTSDANDNMSCKVYRIEDNGVVWDGGTYAQGGDKQWMRVDKTNGPGSGNNYSFWTSYWSICYPGSFTRSTNFGNSYEDCIQVAGDLSWGTLAIGPEGELYIVGAGNQADIMVTKSTTAQNAESNVTWDFTTPVDLDGYLTAQVPVNPVGLLGQAWIDVDVSDGPGRGNVYVLASVVRSTINDSGDVMFAKSSDGGQTWSAPMRINNDLGTNDYQWFGTMSVSPNGRIDVIWLDTRDAPDNSTLSALYYAYSLDQGETWSENEKLSDSFSPLIGWPQQQKMGDYFDMVSDNESAHLAWANTLNGEQDVYYGRISPQTVGLNDSPNNTQHLSLSISPNPSHDQSVIRYDLPVRAYVKLTVVDVCGRVVENLVNAEQEAGFHRVIFNANELTEGVYYCHLQAGAYTATKRVVLLK